MVVRGHPSLSLTRQCRLLSIGRSSLYDRPKGESAETLALMRRIDALFLKYPFYGARQMVRHLRREGVRIGRRRAARLMRLLGLQAVYRAPRTSAPHLGHRVYPYLLRGLAIERPNHVWCADITYIPVRRGFLYLVAIMDWASRCVLAWRLSNTLDAGFCVEALDEALARHGTPQIFNTDQGSQFTGFAFTARLREAGIRISMDGRGRCMDNIFIERLWRSLKYEAVYLHEIADGFAARRVIGQWIGFYNTERPHSALGGRTPAEAYRGDTPVDMMDKPLRALTTYPQAQQQQQKDRSKRILAAQTSTGIHLENAVSLSDKPTPPQVDAACSVRTVCGRYNLPLSNGGGGKDPLAAGCGPIGRVRPGGPSAEDQGGLLQGYQPQGGLPDGRVRLPGLPFPAKVRGVARRVVRGLVPSGCQPDCAQGVSAPRATVAFATA